MPPNERERCTLPIEDELTEYIVSFRASSDRVRRFLYAVIIASILMAMPRWNTREGGWSRYWMDEWAGLEVEQKELESHAQAQPQKPRPGFTVVDAERTAKLVQERSYADEFIKHALFVHIPLLGVTIDINDVAVVGGLALNLLMLLVCLSSIRQHENFYLCAFKLRQLCKDDPQHAQGDSAANFLYHAMAMSQVLLLPPTLARSGRFWVPRLQRAIVTLVYLVPAALFGFVVWGDHIDYVRYALRGMPPDEWKLATVMLLLLLVLTTVARYYSRLVEERFEGAFRMINPHIASKTPRSWLTWLHLRRFFRLPQPERSLMKDLGGATTASRKLEKHDDNIVIVARYIRRRPPSWFSRRALAPEVARAASRQAEIWCDDNKCTYVRLDDVPEVKEDVVIDGHVWQVKVNWPFWCAQPGD